MISSAEAKELRANWALDDGVVFLNHGSFGACPTPVLKAQTRWRERMEREPVRFLSRELEGLLDAARASLGEFVGADPDDLAFVPNATAGANAVLRSIPFNAGDEIVLTDHAYNAVGNAARYAAARAGARVVVAPVPFPIDDPARVVDAVMNAVSPRTRLIVVDHITSATALVFPVEGLVAAATAHGVDVLVDGAHAPGSLPLDIAAIGAAWYVGNCHKWLCAPKGAGFLWARRDRRNDLVPTSVSHGANSERTDRSRFHLLFDWTGTSDPTPYLCVPDAIRFMGSLRSGGWPEVMASNHALALRGRDALVRALRVDPPAPDAMLASMAAVAIPRDIDGELYDRGIEVLVESRSSAPHCMLRISAHVYNRAEEYETLASAVEELLGGAGRT